MTLELVIGAATDRGRVRESNEDSLCVLRPSEIVGDFDALIAVADGMGGHQAGEVASHYVTDKLQELFASSAYRDWVSYDPGRSDYNVLVIKEVLERLNREIYDLAMRDRKHRGMGTTITAALIAQGQVIVGHAGDSRAYLLTNGKFIQLTTDHAWVQEQVEQGKMSPEQAANDPRKNQITRALGVSSMIRIDRQAITLQSGDTLLLCTDGLTNMLSDDEIQRLLITISDPQKACDALVEAANQRGGVDNISVIVACAMNGDSVVQSSAPGHQHREDFDTKKLGKPSRKPTRALTLASQDELPLSTSLSTDSLPAQPAESASSAGFSNAQTDKAVAEPAVHDAKQLNSATLLRGKDLSRRQKNWLLLFLKIGGLLGLIFMESIIAGLAIFIVQSSQELTTVAPLLVGVFVFALISLSVIVTIALNPVPNDILE